MKAWLVYIRKGHFSSDDFWQEIVHSETRGMARFESLLYTEEQEEWVNLGVKRAKEFDDKALTDKLYIEHGWWRECTGCYCYLDASYVADKECFFDENEDAYCVKCWEKLQERLAKEKVNQ